MTTPTIVYPVKLYSWGGQTRVHDYVMSDGSIRTLEDREFAYLLRAAKSYGAISQDKRHD